MLARSLHEALIGISLLAFLELFWNSFVEDCIFVGSYLRWKLRWAGYPYVFIFAMPNLLFSQSCSWQSEKRLGFLRQGYLTSFATRSQEVKFLCMPAAPICLLWLCILLNILISKCQCTYISYTGIFLGRFARYLSTNCTYLSQFWLANMSLAVDVLSPPPFLVALDDVSPPWKINNVNATERVRLSATILALTYWASLKIPTTLIINGSRWIILCFIDHFQPCGLITSYMTVLPTK